MKPEHAIAIGQEALIWLSGQPEALARFLGASGLEPQALRSRAADPDLLGAILDFVLGSDAAVLDFAAAAGLRPAEVPLARAALAGGELPNWT